MRNLHPPIELGSQENESKVNYLLSVAVDFTEESQFDDVSKFLTNSNKIQKTLKTSLFGVCYYTGCQTSRAKKGCRAIGCG